MPYSTPICNIINYPPEALDEFRLIVYEWINKKIPANPSQHCFQYRIPGSRSLPKF